MIFSARRQRSIRIGVYSLTLLFLLRALVPAGFMPAPLASGSPVQLCPQGLSSVEVAALFGQHHQPGHHHQPSHHGGASGQGGQDGPAEEFNCPLGLVISQGFLPTPSIDFSFEQAPATLERDQVVLFQTSRLRAFNPRAPPRHSV